MAIVSVSRRTDIPAFHGEWFMERLRERRVVWRSPFGGRLQETSLVPEDVEAFVFWSKDFAPFLPILEAIESRYRFVLQFTITGLPRIFEPKVPQAEEAIATVRELSRRYGAASVLWRCDPILISDVTDAAYHLGRFRELAARMESHTRRCYFSFPTFYSKTLRRTAKLADQTGIRCCDVSIVERLEIGGQLAEIAAEHGIGMYSCCGDILVGGKVMKAHCVDGEMLTELFPDRIKPHRIRPTRAECGCFESADIGAYDTCGHGCVYCYANASQSST